MSLPPYAVARLSRLVYVRFLLDHKDGTALAVNAGPTEAAHSSKNGLWVHAQLEPFADVHRFGEVEGLTLRIMGGKLRGQCYSVVDTFSRRHKAKVVSHA